MVPAQAPRWTDGSGLIFTVIFPPFNVQTLRGHSKHQTIMMLLLNSFNERLPAKTKLGRLQCAEIILLWWQAQDWDFDPCGPVQAWREFSLPFDFIKSVQDCLVSRHDVMNDPAWVTLARIFKFKVLLLFFCLFFVGLFLIWESQTMSNFSCVYFHQYYQFERILRKCGERYAACNIDQHGWFSGGRWSGEAHP